MPASPHVSPFPSRTWPPAARHLALPRSFLVAKDRFSAVETLSGRCLTVAKQPPAEGTVHDASIGRRGRLPSLRPHPDGHAFAGRGPGRRGDRAWCRLLADEGGPG